MWRSHQGNKATTESLIEALEGLPGGEGIKAEILRLGNRWNHQSFVILENTRIGNGNPIMSPRLLNLELEGTFEWQIGGWNDKICQKCMKMTSRSSKCLMPFYFICKLNMSFVQNKQFTQITQNDLVFLLHSSQIWNSKMFISSLNNFNARSFPRCQVGPLRFPKVVGRLRSPCPKQPFNQIFCCTCCRW